MDAKTNYSYSKTDLQRLHAEISRKLKRPRKATEWAECIVDPVWSLRITERGASLVTKYRILDDEQNVWSEYTTAL